MSEPAVISHISDTARWVATYRAMESERTDAIFHDPFARRLAGERGQAIVDNLPEGRSMAWPLVVRTAVMDEIILRLVTSGGIDTVLNLAAGLDARPWRLALPPALHWVDVDHPAMVEYKSSAMAGETPRCRYEAIGVDLADTGARQGVLDSVAAKGLSALTITEGLLIYLPSEAVLGLARDLHARSTLRYWLTDLASPALIKRMAKSWGKAVAAGNAPFQFAPADSRAFFAPTGWKEIEYRSTFGEGIRLNRSFPMARVWAAIGRLMPKRKQEEFARFSGMALMERV